MNAILTPARWLSGFFLGLSLLLGQLAVRAQWVSSGPLNSTSTRTATQAFIVAPNGNWVAFVEGTGVGNSSFNAIFYSTDAGATWTATGQNLPNSSDVNYLRLRVYQFASQGGALFAASNRGLFTSLDNGVTWSARGTGLPAAAGFTTVRALNGTLFAGFGGYDDYTIPTPPSNLLVYRSLNNGASWQVAGTGLPATNAVPTDFATDGQGTILTGLSASGGNVIFRSRDNGATWQGTNGVPLGFVPGSVGSVGTTLLVSSGGGSNRSILRSTDGGQNWQDASTGLTINDLTDLRAFVVYNNTVYVTDSGNGYLYASTDGGQSWTLDPSAPATFRTLYVQGSTLFGAVFGYRSLVPLPNIPFTPGSSQGRWPPAPTRRWST